MTALGALVLTALAVATAPIPVQNVSAAPGTPGTPQPPTTIFTEDFENRPAPDPVVRLTGYTGSTGQTYTADPPWLTDCNGWVASGESSPTNVTQVNDCVSQQTWNQTQRLAAALGMHTGQTAAQSLGNFAVSAFTAGDPGAPFVEFATTTNVPFASQNRFVSFRVDVAAINCFATHPLLQFSLVDDMANTTPAGGVIDACTSPRTVTPPAIGQATAGPINVGTYTTNGAVLVSGSSIGVRMVNNQPSGGGNDHAFDNITILDVTPQLDKSFAPTTAGIGQPVTLTLTITNTDELGAKNGWSFTDNLPAGLTVVGAATTTCPSGVVTAPAGGSSVAVSGNLSAGMASCTVTVPVTSNTTGSYTNDATNITGGVGISPPGSATVTFTEQPGLSIVKSSTTTLLPAVGGTIPYSFLVTNTGNVTVDNIAVSDPNASPITCPVITLTPGAATTCTGSHTVTQADVDAGSVVNTASVTGTPPSGTPITPVPSNPVIIVGIQVPALSIVKTTSTATIPAVGEPIPYEFLVTNTGNVTIDGIAVTDPNAAPVNCPVTTLAPSESTTCTGVHTVVQADLDAGEVTNTATVSGTSPSGTPIPPVPSNEVTVTGVQSPALTIVKATTTTQVSAVDEVIPYTFQVTNTGNVTITGIAVTDANTTGVNCPDTELAPGETVTCTGTHTVTQQDLDAGQIVNTASVVGTPPSGTPIPPVPSNEVVVSPIANPQLAIVKASTTTDVLELGQAVPYTIQVTNTGNVTMSSITVTDPNVSELFCPDFTLAPGEATTCTATHVVTQADLDAGEIANTASVVGTPPGGPAIPPVPSNEVVIPVVQIESLSMVKMPTTSTLPAVGSPVEYDFAVSNTGNVTMNGINLTDPNATGISCPATTLAPGATMHCSGTHVVTQADINAGAVINTATVVGTPPDGTPISPVPSNEVLVPGVQTPSLAIVKATETTSITAVGQAVPYTLTVTNTGNVTITDIAVSDPKIIGVSCPQTTLDPGVSTVCTATYTTTAADLDSGAPLTNTASVIGTPPSGVPLDPTPSNTVTVAVVQSPGLSIVKSASVGQATTVGQVIQFNFGVTNTGNVTMSNITVTDVKIPNVSCPATTLAAGASMTCTGNYTVTQADVTAGQVVNTASVTGTPPGGSPISVLSNQVSVPIPPPSTPTTMPTPEQLPSTGGNVTGTIQIMSILGLVGLGLVLIARRRKALA